MNKLSALYRQRCKPHLPQSRWLRYPLLIIVAVYLWGWLQRIPFPGEIKTVNALTSSMKTHCIGRHLIDVPKVAIPDYPEYAFKIDWATIETLRAGVTPDEYEEHITAFEQTLLNTKLLYEPKPPLLLKSERLSAHTHFTYAYESRGSDVGKNMTVHTLVGDRLVKLFVNTGDSQYDEARASLLKIAQNLMPMPDNIADIPPGFCAGHVLVKNIPNARERAYVVFGWPKPYDDVLFEVNIENGGSTSEGSLLQRIGFGKAMLERMLPQHSVLRSGNKDAGKIDGEEWLSKVKLKNTQLRFLWETSHKNLSSQIPEIRLELNAGLQDVSGNYPEKPGFSDNEALGIWDAMINSLRVRPNAF
jgi:hypothetical protein